MSWAMWISGRPGSGKSTVTRATAARLAELGESVVVLELDRIRRVLTPAPTNSETEREIVYRALVFMAVALTDVGVPVLIDATGQRRAWRDLARASITRFAEIRIDCPPALAEARACTSGSASGGADPASRPPGGTAPDVNVPYEPAESPELVIDAETEGVDAAAERIAALRRQLWPADGQSRARGVVIWITGPPGSGKTTQASRLAEALLSKGVPVTVLEWAAVRAMLLGGTRENETEHDIAHRALAYTAKLLAEAGMTVVVDATAPRRAWRALARELVEPFAEVQLLCPHEVCLARERTVRWGLRPCPHGGTGGPDIVREYEYSLTPDLVLDTATRNEWSVGEELIRLARRLLRRRLAS
jgi:adenylylsulfate kinase